VAFRVWRPKRSCAPGRDRKKTELVVTLPRGVVAAGCPAAYVAGDTASTGGQVRTTAARLGLTWVGTIAPRTAVVYRGRRQPVRSLAATRKLEWRPQSGGRASAPRAYAPALGPVRLVVLKNAHGNCEYLVSNELTCDLARLGRRKRSRRRIETIFRDTKQRAGSAACQCRVNQALVRHVALVLPAFVGLQVLRCSWSGRSAPQVGGELLVEPARHRGRGRGALPAGQYRLDGGGFLGFDDRPLRRVRLVARDSGCPG
jgi:hypothetical protein